jgi:hypothetical protein
MVHRVVCCANIKPAAFRSVAFIEEIITIESTNECLRHDVPCVSISTLLWTAVLCHASV